jgi:hypothetical protein
MLQGWNTLDYSLSSARNTSRSIQVYVSCAKEDSGREEPSSSERHGKPLPFLRPRSRRETLSHSTHRKTAKILIRYHVRSSHRLFSLSTGWCFPACVVRVCHFQLLRVALALPSSSLRCHIGATSLRCA